MACNLTTGRKVPCKSGVGGIRNVYFADFGTLGDITLTVGEITDMSGSTNWFKYELKGANSLETTITTSRENGTTFYESVLNITLPFLDRATQEEIKLIAVGRPHIVVEGYDDRYYMVGLENGSDLTGGTIVTGAAMGDLSGFTLTFTAQETAPPNFVQPGVLTPEINGAQLEVN